MFALSFYGCYKNRKTGTRDCVSIFGYTAKSVHTLFHTRQGHMWCPRCNDSGGPLNSNSSAPAFQILQSTINVLFLQFLTLFGIALTCINFVWFMSPQFVLFFCALSFMLGSLPILYGTMAAFYWIYVHGRCFSARKTATTGYYLDMKRWRAFLIGLRTLVTTQEETWLILWHSHGVIHKNGLIKTVYLRAQNNPTTYVTQ